MKTDGLKKGTAMEGSINLLYESDSKTDLDLMTKKKKII